MASRTSTEYASKKEFSASLIEFRHFDLLRVNGESLQGDWSTNRSARGANTIYDLYAKAAGLLAKPDFPRFLAAAGRFVSDSEEKYYALWRMVDGKEYFLFKNLSNIAKFEALWDWAQALGAAITLSDGEGAEEQTDDPFDYDSANVEVDFGGNDAASASAITPLLVHAHAPRNCSIGSKGGKTMLYDEDDEKFISLPFDDIEGELGEIEEYEDLEGCGWKYRTEPKGRWGYISPDYAQVISPRFEEILLRSTELQLLTGESNVLAWSRDENNPLSRLDLNFWFSYAGFGNKLRLCRLAELRDAAATLESDNSSLFLPNAFEESMRRATLTLRGSFSVGGEFRCLLRADPIYRFVYEDSKGAVYVEALENGKEGLRLGGSNYPLMAKNLTLDQCEDALASPVEYRSLRYLYSSIGVEYWAEKKDGFWGVFVVSETGMRDAQGEFSFHIDALLHHPEMLAPYAFTDILHLDGFLCLVDRFGQKGVYDLHKNQYIIPCEYDSITIEYKTLTVRHFDQVGKIDMDGTWLQRLHPEKD